MTSINQAKNPECKFAFALELDLCYTLGYALLQFIKFRFEASRFSGTGVT
jgi:hypothetical protein